MPSKWARLSRERLCQLLDLLRLGLLRRRLLLLLLLSLSISYTAICFRRLLCNFCQGLGGGVYFRYHLLEWSLSTLNYRLNYRTGQNKSLVMVLQGGVMLLRSAVGIRKGYGSQTHLLSKAHWNGQQRVRLFFVLGNFGKTIVQVQYQSYSIWTLLVIVLQLDNAFD